MYIRGKIVSISGSVAKVCIIQEDRACKSCSTCPKKMGVQDIIQVSAIQGIQMGQEVVLRDTKNWFTKNKMVFALLAFVSGIILTELLSIIISFGVYQKQVDMLGGGLAMAVMLVVSWVKGPRHFFRIELVEGGKTEL